MDKNWQMRRTFKIPNYTTDRNELPSADSPKDNIHLSDWFIPKESTR
ncbi:DUF4113 domain-containing protein [Methylobacillus caricis]|nr:DUF4113 domain-containing protein [Methylobacillus caricis]